MLLDPRFLHPRPIAALAASADGARLYTLDARHALRCWDRSGALQAELAPGLSRGQSGRPGLLIHGNNLVYSQGGALRCADAASGATRWEAPGGGWLEAAAGDEGLWTYTRGTLAGYGWDGALRWSVAVEARETAPSLIRAPDGSLLLRGQGLERRDPRTGELLEALPVEGEWGARALSPDGEWLALDGGSSHLVAWNLVTGEQQLMYEPAHAYGLRFLCFLADGRRLIASFNTGEIACWDARQAAPLWRFQLPFREFQPLALVGDALAAGARLRVLWLDLSAGALRAAAPCSPLRGLARRSGALYAFATNDAGIQQEQQVHRYDLASGAYGGAIAGSHFFAPGEPADLLCGAHLRAMRGDRIEQISAAPPPGYWFNREYRKAVLLPDGDTIAALQGGNRGWAELWSLSGRELRHTFKKRYFDLDSSPEGARLLLAAEGEVRVADARSRAIVQAIRTGRRRPRLVRFSPDGARAAVMDASGTLAALDLARGEILWTLQRQKIRGFAWALDGAHLWTVSADRLARWDAATGAPAGSWPDAGSYAVLPLPDGRLALGRAGYVALEAPGSTPGA